jgi:AMP phosphorylase
MELKIKFLKWTTGIPVAMLNESTATKIGVNALDRVYIKTDSTHPKSLSTVVNTIVGVVGKDEIAVSLELKKTLNLRKGQKVDVSFSPVPGTLTLIKKKLGKQRLNRKEIHKIVKGVVSNTLSEAEIALFISAMYEHGMTFNETVYLIDAILETGNRLNLRSKIVVDKHSIGGIPGNRTTPLVVSICAAAGLKFPKNSSRAITTAAGTADVIGAIAEVEFPMKDLKRIVSKTNACLVWGGSLGIVPADSKIIKIEKMLKIDPHAQLLASIMSKKLAMGSNHILIDIPYGEGAKVNKQEAEKLKKDFERLGKHFHKKLKCVLTDGRQPIGNGVGPALELIDLLKILNPKEMGPADLEKKSLFLAGELLEMTGKAKRGGGMMMAQEILQSGKALKKFEEIIKAQKGSLKNISPAKFKRAVLATKSGKIVKIKNKEINSLARVTGCPVDKRSGLYLHVHLNDKVKKRAKLLTIYSQSKSRLREAVKFYEESRPIKIR